MSVKMTLLLGARDRLPSDHGLYLAVLGEMRLAIGMVGIFHEMRCNFAFSARFTSVSVPRSSSSSITIQPFGEDGGAEEET